MNSIIKNLSGHSGCIVSLVKENNNIYVKKISSDIDYNFRLKKQCRKQSNFIAQYNVYAPQVFNCGYENNLYYFDMEFINGRTMAEYTSEISIAEIPSFIECLFKCLYYEDYKLDNQANYVFGEKISQLELKLKDKPFLEEAFQILKVFAWQQVYKSFCHGDLTLENILITPDKKLYLIDFLDSFYNSWMIDIAKLLQDLELKWSFRNMQVSSNRELRLQVAKEALIGEILKTKNGEQNLVTIYHILLLNILRIYPYTNNQITFDYLCNAVKSLIKKIKTEERGALV